MLFDALVGHIRELQYGVDKWHHFHRIFLFDGSKVLKDAYLVDLM